MLIRGIEALGPIRVIGDQLDLKGPFWAAIGSLKDNFNDLGFAIIVVLIAAWSISFESCKTKRLDEMDLRTAGNA